MKRLFLLLAPFLLGDGIGQPVIAQVPSTITVSPHGATLITGSSLQFAASCTYTSHATDDCTYAGGVVWSSPTLSSKLKLSASGMATWISDPGSGNVQDGAWGFVIATAGKKSDRGQIVAQHAGDTWFEYPTPDIHNFIDNNGALQPLTVVVGSVVAVGAGVQINQPNGGYSQAFPFSMTCNWSSSDATKAEVDRHGLVTAIAPGKVTITCGRAGDGVYGSSHSGGWIAPGNTLALTVVAGGTGTATWYVRPDGGTPFLSKKLTSAGQCDGKHDAAYPGSGTNQPCAFGDFEDLYFDQVNHSRQAWMISGGDTVIVRQKPGGYNVAMNKVGYSPTNCGDEIYCDINISIPSGTAAHHTRILGENYANCHGDAAKTLLTLNGREAFNMKDSQFVDLACFEITDKAACAMDGEFKHVCQGGKEYFGRIGIVQSALTSQVNYTDLFIDGLAQEGIHGAAGSSTVVADYVHIRGAAMAGINMDDGPWVNSNISVAGGFTMNHSITEFSGCVEEYPVTHNYPYIECRDQSTAPSAALDGFGMGVTTGDWYFDHDIWRYNMQDGLDMLHSGMQSLTVTNSQSYGNDGQAYKIGPADKVIFRNNTALVNCNRVGQVIGDEPASAIVPGVTLCRAAGDWMPMQFTNEGTYLLQNNTWAGYGSTVFDFGCANGWDSCVEATAVFQNNIVIGYSEAGYNDGQTPGVFYESSGSSKMPRLTGWSARDHNVFYNVRNYGRLQPGEVTTSPRLAQQPTSPISNEQALDTFSYAPTSGTPTGTPIAGTSPDMKGAVRAKSPKIGAIEYVSDAPRSGIQRERNGLEADAK